MRRPAAIPLVHQPGEGWTYNTGAHILGVLLARLEGVPLGGVLADTVLEPLGVSDTGCRAAWRPRPDDRLCSAETMTKPH